MHMSHFKLMSILLVLILISTGACSSAPKEPICISGFKLNTIVNITLYDTQDERLLQDCLDICDRYELLFSRTREDSELYQLNHGSLQDTDHTASLSDDTINLIQTGIYYSELSGGNFDISMAPLTDLWDFSSPSPEVPSENAVKQAVSLVNYKDISIVQDKLSFKKTGMGIDAGAIAKGYIADRIKDYLLAHGVESAIINLGGNVLCVGNKPDEKPFSIGIQKPFEGQSKTMVTVEVEDKSVVSSGIYQRYFEPVSYTHLDVYKRQVYHRLDQKNSHVNDGLLDDGRYGHLKHFHRNFSGVIGIDGFRWIGFEFSCNKYKKRKDTG